MMQLELFQLTLIIFTIFSTIWAIRAHFKNYQKEDSVKAAEFALTAERITYLNQKFEILNQRVSEVERQQSEIHVMKSQMNLMYDDLKSVKTKIDSIIQILVEEAQH